MNKKITLFLLAFITGGAISAQNVGIGTANPLEKLHVAGGTVRVDGMSLSGAFNGIPLTANDRMVWVDGLGTLHSLNNGGNGQILAINGSGVPVWINPATPSSLSTGNVWIGDATNAPLEHPLSGDVTMDMNGVTTIQDNAVDGTDISITGEGNGSIMYFDGTDWVNLGIGTAGQTLVVSGTGIPSWINSNAALTTHDVLNAAGGAVVVTNGTGQVVGASDVQLDVQNNTVSQKGLVTAPTVANPFKVWGTDASGNPDWRDPATVLAANAKDITAGAGNNAVSITNGAGQLIGAANAVVNVASNGLGQDGVVTGTTGANANQVWGTDASGNPAWVLPASVLAANASDVTTANPAITIGNGTNQVIGATDMTIDVANNSATSAGLVTAGGANPNQVWGTNGAGVPAWTTANAALVTKDITTTNPSISITNGAGQTIGAANVTIDVANNALNVGGLVAAPTGANANQVWGTDASGNPAWVLPASVLAANASDVTTANPAITIGNGTNQVIGATDMTIDVANNSATSAGLVTAGGANPNQVWGTNGAGVPAWTTANAALVTKDITATNPAITITNGTGQTIGAANVVVDVANNSATSAGLVTAGGANPNQVWGTDGAGVPAWTTANAALVTKDITTTNPSISITNGAGQTIGAANVTIDVANNALNVGGLVAAPTGANANQVWGTDASGNPAWVLPASVLAANASDVTTANPAITIGNGTNQVIGATDMTIDIANNSATSAGLVTAGGANPNQVWGTNGAGVPAWTTANAALTTKNVVAGAANNSVSITNGTAQVIGATDVTVNVATNALNQAGVVTGPTVAQANMVWGTTAAGVPGWIDPTNLVDVDNGLYYNNIAGKVRLGGGLVENTLITNGSFNYTQNLNGTGTFEIQDAANSAFLVDASGNVIVNNSAGTRGLRVAGTTDANLIFTDATNNRVGIGTATPADKLDISGLTNTVRIGGVATGGSHLAAPTATTDKILFANATGQVKGMPNGANNSFLTINNAGIPTWQGMTVLVDNGLYYNTVAGKIRQGGALVENTTITGAAFNYTHDLTGIGDFIVTEASNATPSLFVKGNDLATTDGYVGIGTNVPTNRLHINNTIVAGTTANTIASYPFAVGYNNNLVDYTIGSNGSFVLEQSWNSKPLLINSQGNFVGVNLGTAPAQNLDINGRLAVRNGVIQTYANPAAPVAITGTSDLGLYSQVGGNYIRIATNAAPIKFYTDQGGAGGSGSNAIVNIDNANGGGVAIGANTGGATDPSPSSKAVLDVQSTTKGQHIPRMTTAQRDAIVPGANQNEGLLIYNTDNDCVEFWDTKATTTPLNGFWNSMCKYCEDVYVYAPGTSNGNNFFTQAGSPNRPKKWCVFVNAGTTLGASTQGGTALNFSSLPGGSVVYLYNNGTIIGGGGNGGQGGQESDAACNADNVGGNGGNGGHAVVGSATVQVIITNSGLIGGGGTGGGGGAGGCRSNGGGGGGGAGIPVGIGGGNNTLGRRTNNFTCLGGCITAPASTPGSNGFQLTGGGQGCSGGTASAGCTAFGTITAASGGCGGNGAAIGLGGALYNGSGTTCGTLLGGAQFGYGGIGGNALLGNGGASYLTNVGAGSSAGAITP